MKDDQGEHPLLALTGFVRLRLHQDNQFLESLPCVCRSGRRPDCGKTLLARNHLTLKQLDELETADAYYDDHLGEPDSEWIGMYQFMLLTARQWSDHPDYDHLHWTPLVEHDSIDLHPFATRGQWDARADPLDPYTT